MELQYILIKLLVDTSTLILIIMVQWLIYPSFKYLDNKQFTKWHDSHMHNISFIAGPLMVFQLLITAGGFFVNQTPLWFDILNAILVATLWLFTFGTFVPLHNQLSRASDRSILCDTLVFKNKGRVILWFLVFILNFFLIRF